MPLLTWQLWLAKDVVTEIRLPWQKSLPELTPGRVVQSMLPLLIRIGSPAVVPFAARKFRWMANRKTAHSKMSLSCGQKGYRSVPKITKIDYLTWSVLSKFTTISTQR
jgi:hypothetical protein